MSAALLAEVEVIPEKQIVPIFETVKCSRCPEILTYELQPGFSELESMFGAADSEDWETRNRELLCPRCVEHDQFYRDETQGR